MRYEVYTLAAVAIVLAFFSWPVPRVVKDILHSGVGRLAALAGIAYVAKYQSCPVAVLLAIYYVKATNAAYHEGMENKAETEEEKKKREEEEKKKKAEETVAALTASSGNVATSSGSSASATGTTSAATEGYQNFASF